MRRLIDANALKRQFIDYVRTPPHFHYGDWQNMCINGTEIDEVIENAPTVQAVAVAGVKTISIHRTDGDVNVLLLPHKDGSGWSFVNLTKGHICPCKFLTKDDAMRDLRNQENIISYSYGGGEDG